MVRKKFYLLLLLVSSILVPFFSCSSCQISVDFPYHFQDRDYKQEAGKTGEHQEVEITGKHGLSSILTGAFTAGITGNEKITEVSHSNPGYGKTVYGINTQSGKLSAVAYSPDGKIIASGGEDRIVKLWDTESGKEIPTREMKYHTTVIEDLTFSPDGKVLVSCGRDRNIVIWNVTSGDVIKVLTGSLGDVYSVDISLDGQLLASCGDYGSIKIWRTANWTEEKTISAHFGSIYSVHFSPDGKLLASGSDDHFLKFWNTTSWKLDSTHSPLFFLQELRAVRFSPDGKYLAIGCRSSTFAGAADMWLYDTESRTYDPLVGHVNAIGDDAIDFSPEGKLLATGASDETVRLWNVTSKETVKVLAGHHRAVDAVAFSPDGTMVASCGYDGIIWLWNVVRGAIEGDFIGHESTVFTAVFSPDGQTLASGSYDNNIILWNMTTEDKMFELGGHDAAVHSVAFSPDGKLLVSGSWDTTVRLWNVTDGNELPASPLTHHANAVWPVIFSLDGTIIISGSMIPENAIRLWNVTSGTELPVSPLIGHSNDVSSLALSPDGSLLASGSWDSTIIIWNITSGQKIRTLIGHEGYVNSVAFSPGGELLASGGWDNTVRIWNVTNGQSWELGGQSGVLRSVAFSPDGEMVAAGSIEGTIQLWNVTSEEKSLVKTIYAPAASVFSVDFSPDGKMLVSGDNHGNIRLWNVNAIPDCDLDGMPDDWESDYSLDPADFWDKFNDADNDGLMNSLEYVRGSSPLERDSDGDGMSDGWEHLSGVDPANINDATDDDDDDGIIALYEFQTGLDPWHNDGAGDKDEDGLTNLQEFQYGSWANQADSDLDGMRDDFEYEYGLEPLIDDSRLDKDNDLMDNLYEYLHGLDATNASDRLLDKDGDRMNNQYEAIHKLNASDPSDAHLDKDNDGINNWYEAIHGLNASSNDAGEDPDGDWVNNVNEFRAGTNPKKFWDFPILSFSIFHAFAGILLLTVSVSAIFLKLRQRSEKQMLVTARLKAPDYQTALKVMRSEYPDYFEYIRAISGAQAQVEDGTVAYYQGDPARAKNLYEQALAIFDRVDSKSLVAETVFRIASVMKESQELKTDSEILKRFPPWPWKEPIVEAIDQMIKALLAETEMNWGMANQAWQAALNTGALSEEFQIICQGSLAGFAVRNWLDNPDATTRELLISQLDEWLEVSKIYKQYASLCQGYLLRSRVAFASIQFDEVEEWLNKCSRIAEENNLVIYRELALKEIDTLSIHKQRVSAILKIEKPITPEEQERMLRDYIRKALESLKREGLE